MASRSRSRSRRVAIYGVPQYVPYSILNSFFNRSYLSFLKLSTFDRCKYSEENFPMLSWVANFEADI